MSLVYCNCTSHRFMGLKPTTATNDLCDKCGHHVVHVSRHELFPHNPINSKGSISGYRPLTKRPETWQKAGIPKEVMDEARNET